MTEVLKHTVLGSSRDEVEQKQKNEWTKSENIPHSCSHHGEPSLSAGLLDTSAEIQCPSSFP